MGSLFSVLHVASNALGAYQRAMNVTSANTANAATPGYAKQVVQFEAQPFDPQIAVGGGVTYGGTVDTRDQFAEENVRQRVSDQGKATQEASQYASLESVFPVDGQSGLSAALNSFFQAFSALTTTPNDPDLRQNALNGAQHTAQAFRTTIQQLDEVQTGVQQNLTEQVNAVNQLAQQIATINQQVEHNASAASDPGLSARMSQALERLSQYVDVTATNEDNGTVSVSVGQATLVSGDKARPLQLVPKSGQMVLQDSQGNDIAQQLSSGSLQAALNMADHVLPGMAANINQLAQSFATAVNGALAGGVDQTNNPPAQDLFSFNAANGAAATLTVNSLTPAQLALAAPTAPGGNAVAVQIANLQNARLINGQTLSQYYGSLASQVGGMVSNAQNDQTTAENLTAQAQSARQKLQGVSLDEEAMNLLEFQRGYEAMSQFVKAVNEMTQELIANLVQ